MGRLKEDLVSPDTKKDFLEGLLEYLSFVTLDGGVDSDRIYVTAVKTENVGAWAHIDHHRLVTVLNSIDREVASVFLSGLSKSVEAELRPLVFVP